MVQGNDGIGVRRQGWQESLAGIQAKTLKYSPAFPEVAERWNAWWKFEADRPLVVAQLAGDPSIRWDKGFDLLDQPEEWLRLRRRQVEETYRVGETLPTARVDIGPVAMAAFLGAPLHFAPEQATSWHDPIIESWENRPRLGVDWDNECLQTVLGLLEKLAADACGNYLVCLPDMTGALDALANLRGTEKLCIDLYESRDQIMTAASEAVNAWEAIFSRMYDTVLERGAGITQWVTCWADTPFTVPTCDFNALIGREDFTQVCMPSLKEQAKRAGLCVFHLDGPDAARHAEVLAGDPDITAIQFTPGAGTPSALAMLPMLRRVQEHRVPLFIEVPLDEVKPLLKELDPRGVAIRTGGFKSETEADELMDWRDKTFA